MFKNNKYLFLVPIISGILFLALVLTYSTSFFQKIDLDTLHFVINATTVPITIFFEVVTMLASWRGIAIVLILIFIFSKKKIDAFIVAIMEGCAYLLSTWIKEMVERPRPDTIQLSPETGFSFPSNHTAVAVVFYGVILFLVWQRMKNKSTKILITIIVSLVVILIGMSRIYLRVHYVSDVLAGALLGITILGITYIAYIGFKPYIDKFFLENKPKRKRQIMPKADSE